MAWGTGGRFDMGSPYENCFMRLYDIATRTELASCKHKYPVTALAFSPDSRFALAGENTGSCICGNCPLSDKNTLSARLGIQELSLI
jgi:WD40 repeat protein